MTDRIEWKGTTGGLCAWGGDEIVSLTRIEDGGIQVVVRRGRHFNLFPGEFAERDADGQITKAVPSKGEAQPAAAPVAKLPVAKKPTKAKKAKS